MKPTSFTHSV